MSSVQEYQHASLNAGERLDLKTLKDVNIHTRQGTVVPLSQVARVKHEPKSRCSGAATATWRSARAPR